MSRKARCAGHHRQPRFHPSRRAARARARAGNPDRRLCLPVGLGLAAGPRARHARLCRSCAGAVAVRAEGMQRARRAALHLCRPSAGRADRRACGRMLERRARRDRPAAAAGVARQPRPAKSGAWRRCLVRRSRACAEQFGAIEVVVPTVPRLAPTGARGNCAWRVPARVIIGCRRERCSLPQCARGADEIGHLDARTGACRRADGRRLQGVADRGIGGHAC